MMQWVKLTRGNGDVVRVNMHYVRAYGPLPVTDRETTRHCWLQMSETSEHEVPSLHVREGLAVLDAVFGAREPGEGRGG